VLETTFFQRLKQVDSFIIYSRFLTGVWRFGSCCEDSVYFL